MGGYSDELMIITADTVKLLNTLNENLIKHKEDFRTAKVGWEKSVKEHKDQLLTCLSDTDDQKIYIGYMNKLSNVIKDEPTSYEESYEVAIEMLEWHQGTEFKLERDQFRKYVQNKWDWQRSFTQNTLRFSG